MIKYGFLAIFVLSQYSMAFGQEQKGYSLSDKENFAVSNYNIKKPSKVSVTIPSIRSEYNTEEDCGKFKITPTSAKYFFKHSVSISGNSFGHDYVSTSCYSEGTIKFPNGDEGTWTILRYGRGIVSIKKGGVKVALMFLYCRKCDAIDNRE